jgi:hypothetical protein
LYKVIVEIEKKKKLQKKEHTKKRRCDCGELVSEERSYEGVMKTRE